MRSPSVLVAALLVALATLFGVAHGAAATTAAYPPPACGQIYVSSTVLAPGASLTVSGRGFGPRTALTIELVSGRVVLARSETSESGEFSALVTLPRTVSGTQSISVLGAHVSCSVLPIRIQVGSGTSPGTSPASTGVDVEGDLTLAGALLALGLGLLGLGRLGLGQRSAGRTRAGHRTGSSSGPVARRSW